MQTDPITKLNNSPDDFHPRNFTTEGKSVNKLHLWSQSRKVVKEQDFVISHYLVVDACAMMFPPIGFLGSAWNIEAPSTCATTWFVITTAIPNWMTMVSQSIHIKKKTRFITTWTFIGKTTQRCSNRQQAWHSPKRKKKVWYCMYMVYTG